MTKQTDPTRATVSANLRRLRTGRGWTTQHVSDRLTAAGHTLSRPSISRLESGTRDASASDVMALAVLFDVSPVALLLPMADDLDDIDVTGKGRTHAGLMWDWALGKRPLTYPEDRAAMWRYQTESLPPHLRYVEKER